MNYLDTMKKRRSIYAFDETKMGNEEIKNLVGEVIRLTPDAFSMQSQKIVLLLDDKSVDFWKKVNQTFDNSINEEKQAGFEAAKGTILYFTDQQIVGKMMEQFPLYAENFPRWADHSNGMLQINMWNALAEQGLGASIQHYNPVIDQWVKEDYEIPDEWTLIAQMPFGTPGVRPDEKEFPPLDTMMKIFE